MPTVLDFEVEEAAARRDEHEETLVALRFEAQCELRVGSHLAAVTLLGSGSDECLQALTRADGSKGWKEFVIASGTPFPPSLLYCTLLIAVVEADCLNCQPRG